MMNMLCIMVSTLVVLFCLAYMRNLVLPAEVSREIWWLSNGVIGGLTPICGVWTGTKITKLMERNR